MPAGTCRRSGALQNNSTGLANGLFALAGAGAFLFVLLLAIRNAAPPGV